MEKEYPKVLVIGLSFETSTGSGITLTNQFKGWDPSKLAAAAENICIDESICKNNYTLGYAENKRRFPFNLIQKKNISGQLTSEKVNSAPPQIQSNESFLKKAYLKLLQLAGLYYYSRNLKISPSFKAWVIDFQPDYIYTTANEPEVIRLVKEVQAITGSKIITHIWDDLIKNYFNQPGLFYQYRKNYNNKALLDLLNKSTLCLSISSAMGAEYYKRYGKKFKTFHNCLDFGANQYPSKENYKINGPFTILYAGRVGVGISDCLIDVCKAIEQLEVNKFELHIQTTSTHIILDKLKVYSFVKVRPVVSYDEIKRILASADLLLLPYNFDKHSVELLRLSMPTKIPEYMISGTPILLYADEKMFITQFAKDNSIAYVLDNAKISDIARALEVLSVNEELRSRLGNDARNYAIQHFNAAHVRSDFRELLQRGLDEDTLTERTTYSS